MSQLGNNDIKSESHESQGAKIDPILRLYPGAPLMCNTNDALKFGRGNGTLCHCIKVRMKQNASVQWKNWDGRKVNTTSVDQIEWIEFEHCTTTTQHTTNNQTQTKFFSLVVQFPPSHNCDKDFLSTKSASLSFQSMQQLQQQGISCREWSKDVLIVKSWDYCMANCVYVSLFRVRTLSGLYLCKPLALDKSFEVPPELINFE